VWSSWGSEGFFSKGGPLGYFSRVAKSGEICFFPLETNKTSFLVKFLKSRWPCSPFRRRWWVHSDKEIYSANTVTDDRKYTLVANSYKASLEKYFKIENRCEWSACFHVAFSLWCRNSKAFCGRPFALQRQQPKKYKLYDDVASFPGKISADAHGYFHHSASFEVWARQATANYMRIEN